VETCVLKYFGQPNEEDGDVVTLIYSSWLRANLPTGSSWEANGGGEQCDLLNLQPVTESTDGYWMFVVSQRRKSQMWI